MKKELKAQNAEVLLKASDLLLSLMKGDIRPVCLRKFTKSDGSNIYTFAHANGVFNLEKCDCMKEDKCPCSEKDKCPCQATIDGKTKQQHLKLKKGCEVAITHFENIKDELLKTSDTAMLLSKHSTMLQLKQILEKSIGALDVFTEFEKTQSRVTKPGMSDNRVGRPEELDYDPFRQQEQAAKDKKLGRGKFLHDMIPGNENAY